MRRWLVAGGIVESSDGLLLVKNRRRTGAHDWSPPGGVVDETDASPIAALTREVEEETGLLVSNWQGPVYEVEAVAAGLGWTMRCEVYVADGYEGDLRIADPDGIVVDALFVPIERCPAHLEACYPWVREPLTEWLTDRWVEPRGFRYDLRGETISEITVIRAGATGR
jgi:8-oxo-dGTP pyrophosphatase MutT (NUDIX family)